MMALLASAIMGCILLDSGVGKLFKIGNPPINSRIADYYNLERPGGAQDWQTVFTY